MGLVQDLVIQYRANVTQAVRGIEDLNRNVRRVNQSVDRSVGAITEKMNGMGRAMSIGITAPLLMMGKAAVETAMSATESENLFAVSMGKMAVQARQWSEQLSKSLGLNGYEIRKNVSTFNIMLDSMDMGTKRSYEMAKGLTTLAYDMASLYNLDTEDAFEKLQSGISGEVEPLKRLGIIVNDTRVKTYAYTQGLAKQGAELTDQQKILARYGLIMEATQKAQGDLKRTGDSTTNSFRTMKSQLAEVSITFGSMLIPTIDKALKVAKDYTLQLSAMSQQNRDAILKMGLFAAATGPAILGLSAMTKAVFTLRAAFIAFGATASAITAGAIAAVAAIGYAVKAGMDKTSASASAGSSARFTGKTSRQAMMKKIQDGLAKDYTKGSKLQIINDYIANDIFSELPYGGPADAYKALKAKKNPSVLDKRQIKQYEEALATLRKVEAGTDNKKGVTAADGYQTIKSLMGMGALGGSAKGSLKPANPFKTKGIKVVPKKKASTTSATSFKTNLGVGLGIAGNLSAYNYKTPMEILETELDNNIMEQERNSKKNSIRQKYIDDAKKTRDELLANIAERIKAYREESEAKKKSIMEMRESLRQQQRDQIQFMDPRDIWRNLMADSVRRQYGPNRNTYTPANLNGPATANEVQKVQNDMLDEDKTHTSLLTAILDKISPPVHASEMLPNAY